LRGAGEPRSLCLPPTPVRPRRDDRYPHASGLSNFARITAGSFAVSVSTTVWDRGEAAHQTRLAETMAAVDPNWTAAIDRLRHAGLGFAQAVCAIDQQVVNQAYLLSTIDFFRASAWIMLALIPCVWLTNRALGAGAGHPAAD
jgi:MFS transporter, DHA2 family, multidrug resistance protein